MGAQIYEVATGRAVSPVLKNRDRHYGGSVAFSPDGQMVITGGSDGTVRRWSVPSGQALGRPLTQFTAVNLVAFSPNGRFLATAQRGGLVRIWALPTANPRDYALPLDGKASLAKLSHDGRYLIATGSQSSLSLLRSQLVYEVATGQPKGPPLETGGFIRDAAFSPDGRHAATLVSFPVSNAKLPQQRPHPQVKLWDWRTGILCYDPLPLPSEPRSLAYSPDGQCLAVLCELGQLVLIDSRQGQITRQWQVHPGPIEKRNFVNDGAVCYSPDGQSLLTYGIDFKVRVWDATTGQERYPALEHQQRCPWAQFSPDGRLLATAGDDNTVRLWDFATGRPVTEPLRHPDWVLTPTFSLDGRHLLTGCRDGMVRLWDWRTGRLVCPPFPHEHEVLAVAFHPNGRWILTACFDKTLRVWDWRTGKPVTPPLATGGAGLSLGITPNGQYAVVGGLMDALKVVHLGDLSERVELAPDDLYTWAELVSGQHVQEGGGVASLTAEEWLERWRAFRRRHPDYSKIDLDSPPKRPGK
jgi:WD40 repeat protein